MNLNKANSLLENLNVCCREKIGEDLKLPFDGFDYRPSCAALMEITLQHSNAFFSLANISQNYFFAAASCARAAIEASTTVAWICEPKSKIEKEGRWLGYNGSLRRFHRIINQELSSEDPELSSFPEEMEKADKLVRERKIDGESIPVVDKPNQEQMMRVCGIHDLYASYRELCQIVHVGPELLMRFKEKIEIEDDVFGYRIQQEVWDTDWHIPYLTIAHSVANSVMTVLYDCGMSPKDFNSIHLAQVELTEYIQNKNLQQ